MSSVLRVSLGWQPQRGNAPMLTPAGNALIVPSEALATAIALEWAEIKGPVHRSRIPFTQYANTAIDHTAIAPEAAVRGFVSHGESDTLCFRVAEPAALQERQAAQWDGWIDWAEQRLGFRPFVFTGLFGMKQDQDVLKALTQIAQSYEPFRLLALAQAAGLLGSAILALAMLEGKLPHQEALRLSLLEELFQSEQWGEPEEIKERRDDLAQELRQLSSFINLLIQQ